MPDTFKTAVVSLFIKKANLPSDDLRNYRPVSGLSFISKLVEHVVAKQLLEHIYVHNLDNSYQSAYKDASVLVANALVSSRLDYCNLLFRSLSKFNLHQLQCIQNSAARIVSNTSGYISITPVLKKLHWLPVEQHTVFKTATLVYKFLHTRFPRYFAPYLSSYSNPNSTRCSQSDANFLAIPKFYPSVHKSVKQFGNNFAFDAPTV